MGEMKKYRRVFSRPQPPLSNPLDQEDCKRLKATSLDKPTSLQGNSDGSHSHRSTDPVTNSESVLTAYLERQCRNDIINLAFQIGFDRGNIAFVFYENHVRRLMD